MDSIRLRVKHIYYSYIILLLILLYFFYTHENACLYGVRMQKEEWKMRERERKREMMRKK